MRQDIVQKALREFVKSCIQTLVTDNLSAKARRSVVRRQRPPSLNRNYR